MPFDAPIHTNEANLPRVLGAGLPVLLTFTRSNCPPCDQLMPVLDRLARAFAGRALVVKVNADEEPGLLRRYSVSGLPSTVFIQDGRPQATAIGAASERDLVAWLDYLASGGVRPPVPTGPSIALQVAAAAAKPAGGPQPSAAPPRPEAGTTRASHRAHRPH